MFATSLYCPFNYVMDYPSEKVSEGDQSSLLGIMFWIQFYHGLDTCGEGCIITK